jgi:nucleoside-diphosphate-sugar epimerase
MTPHLLIFGLGYTGQAVATLARNAGYHVTAASRDPAAAPPISGVEIIPFARAEAAIARATHLLATAPPGPDGDPVLAAYADRLAAAPTLRWICYLSTTGVYGDRQGGWVDETTAPAPASPRAHRRRAAEQAWSQLAAGKAVELFRLAGIYGPGRSALDDLRAGSARRIIAPNHLFGRIHRDDIAGAVLAAAARVTAGIRILHGNDNLPAASSDVIEEAARLLVVAPPPAISFEAAWPTMSEMARSFWAENRRVASVLTRQSLGRDWTYPSYREGLAAILSAEQFAEHIIQHPQIPGA